MNSDAVDTGHELGVIHHMARSGGTLISRCLASMDGVVLLSEIHPQGIRMFNPLDQADRWYGLLTEQDIRTFRSNQPSFLKAIQLISKRCREQNRYLILRDWSHLDFTGVPFTQPKYRSALVDELQPHFRLRRFSTVRHPLDQWLSITRKQAFLQRLNPSEYLKGVLRFSAMAEQTGRVRYEAFTEDPDAALQRICTALGISFDPGYAQRWSTYTHITGDVLPGRAGDRITRLPRQQAEEERVQALTGLAQWPSALSELGYAD